MRLNRVPSELDSAARIIIFEGAGSRTWGLQVDSVSAVVQVGRDQLEDAAAGRQPAGVLVRWLAGLARLEGRQVALLNMDEVLASGEAEAAAALVQGEAS